MSPRNPTTPTNVIPVLDTGIQYLWLFSRLAGLPGLTRQ